MSNYSDIKFAGTSAQEPPFRNIIINGDMSIAQRGTSVSSISSGTTYNTADRWQFQLNSAGTWTQSQDTDVPTGQGFAKSLKIDCTTANGSLSAGSYSIIAQKIEGQNLQYLKKGTANAESVTMSFWVKSNKTGTYILELNDEDNTRSISKSYTIDSADTWEKKTITFAGDTTGAFDNDNASSLRIFWWLAAGTDYTSGTLNTSWGTRTNANIAVGQVNLADDTANNFWITGVQLEAGTTASDFEFLPRPTVLQQCHRYYYKIQGGGTHGGGGGYAFIGNGVAVASTNGRIGMIFPVPLRAVPSISYAGAVYYEASSQRTITSIATSIYSTEETGKLMFDNTLSASVTVGSGGVAFTNQTTAQYIDFNSEL